ncbi:MAG: hypothetical protein ACLVH2_00315 [Streptococcus sp.]
MLEDRNIAQVSINMIGLEQFPLYRVVETVRFEAQRYGVRIIGTNSLDWLLHLIDSAEYYLQLKTLI